MKAPPLRDFYIVHHHKTYVQLYRKYFVAANQFLPHVTTLQWSSDTALSKRLVQLLQDVKKYTRILSDYFLILERCFYGGI